MLAGWTLVALVDLLRGRLAIGRWHWTLGGTVAAIGVLNAVDFAGLGGHPDLRRDILNHLQNVWFTVLLALTCAATPRRSRCSPRSSGRRCWRRPSRWRAGGSAPCPSRAGCVPMADRRRDAPYLGYDFYFNRATSAFYDPNFYGIYSALVVLTALGLWMAVAHRRWLLWVAALNVVFLSASLSRTGLMGLLGGLAAACVVYRRHPKADRRLMVLAAAATCVCFLAGTAVQSRANRARLAAWWAGDPSSLTADTARGGSGPAAVMAPPDRDRLIGSASVSDRFRRIGTAGASSSRVPGSAVEARRSSVPIFRRRPRRIWST